MNAREFTALVGLVGAFAFGIVVWMALGTLVWWILA